MVCNLHFPTGTIRSSEFRIWNRRAFQERKPYQFPGRMKNSPYYCPGWGASPQSPAHPDFLTSKLRSPTPYSFGHREAVNESFLNTFADIKPVPSRGVMLEVIIPRPVLE